MRRCKEVEEKESHKKTLSVKELAERWSVPASTIYNRINDGTIPVLPLEGTKRVLLEVVEEIEYNSVIQKRRTKTLEEKRLEQEKKEYEKRIEEIKNDVLEINRLTTKVLMKTKV